MPVLAATTWLANQPTGAVAACLIVALVLFIVAGVAAAFVKALWAAVICAGFAFFALAFLIR